jgi:uncharacterized protein YjbI with pentapeptide repeats
MFLKKKKKSILPGFFQKIQNWFSQAIKTYSKTKITISILFFLSLAIYSCFLIFVGGYLQSAGFHYKFLKPAFLRTETTLKNYYKSIFSEIDHIDIDIKHTDFMKLEYARNLAIQSGTLAGIKNEYINAKIRYRGKTVPVKLRLKGRTSYQHQAVDKWSMRVKVKGDATLFRMKRFSLMDPMRRNLMHTWFFRQAMRKEGVISKRYKFVDVSINGTSKGLYAVDEYYDKVMLENNHRKEGPVIRFEQEAIFIDKPQGPPSEWNDFYDKIGITTFSTKKLASKKELFSQFQHATNLLQAFRLGELKTNKVFDIEKLAKWMAVGDLFGGWHGFAVNNMRFYYNPITSRLEPVPDDHFNEFTKPREARLLRLEDKFMTGKFVHTMFDDFLFAEQYGKELERISKIEYLDNLFKDLRELTEKTLRTFYSDRSLLWYLFPKEMIYKNQKRIRLALNPHKAIQAFTENNSFDSVNLSIANNERMAVEIANVDLQGKNLSLTNGKKSLFLKGREMGKPPEFFNFKFSLPSNTHIDKEKPPATTISYKLLGTNKIRKATSLPYPSYSKKLLKGGISREKSDFKNFTFLDIDTKENLIILKKGHWKLEQDLVIPKGFKVILSAETVLDMVNSSKILSYSPLKVFGTKDYPVVITSSDATGQGITVINVKEESIFENVIFKNLSPPSNDKWKLSGAINFYESPVQFNRTTFSNNIKGDDFLNIIRSKFIISDSQFKQTFADAFDSDFSSGTIENTSFQNCGASGKNGDGVDLSGSSIKIENVTFENIGDKALSIGENSVLKGVNIEIKNSRIAIASKDLSYSKLNNLRIKDSKIGLAVFQKKTEYGPSRLEVKNLIMEGVDKPNLVESGSKLFIEGNSIKPNKDDVKKFLYPKK